MLHVMMRRSPKAGLSRRRDLAAGALRRWADAFRNARSGNVAIIFALGMPVVAAGAAFSAETSYQYYKHQRLQAAADAAAFAGALEQMNGSGVASVQTAASSAATSNGWRSAAGTIQVNTPPTSGPNRVSQAVEVILTQTEPRFFTAIFTSTPVVLHRRAVAISQVASSACVVALNRSASRAIDVTGNASMNLAGCDVASNSTAADALHVWGSADLKADCAMTVGGIANNGGLNLSTCPGGMSGARAVDDPYGDLETPTPQGPCISTSSYNGASLTAGYYCNGLSLKGSDTLAPGVYYVSGGDFTVNGNAYVTGSGVTIYLSGSARVSINGSATLRLSAPTSGTYSGILFYGDRSSSGGSINKFNGDSSSELTGNLYFPSQSVAYNGNFSGNKGCTYVVADTVSWSGSANFSVDCTSEGMQKIPARDVVKLVE